MAPGTHARATSKPKGHVLEERGAKWTATAPAAATADAAAAPSNGAAAAAAVAAGAEVAAATQSLSSTPASTGTPTGNALRAASEAIAARACHWCAKRWALFLSVCHHWAKASGGTAPAEKPTPTPRCPNGLIPTSTQYQWPQRCYTASAAYAADPLH